MTASVPALFVFGSGAEGRAIRTTLTAKVIDQQGVSYTGCVTFTKSVQKHISDTVYPLLLSIVAPFGVSAIGFELSVTNIAAASLYDQGFEIKGFSADVPIFLAMLSSSLGIRLRESCYCTGHIASTGGDIVMVQHLAAKAKAIPETEPNALFCYPEIQDSSLTTLRPSEQESLKFRLREMTLNGLRSTEVSSVEELYNYVFPQVERWRWVLESELDVLSAKGRYVEGLLPSVSFSNALKEALLNEDFTSAFSLLESYENSLKQGDLGLCTIAEELKLISSTLPPHISQKLQSKPASSLLANTLAQSKADRDASSSDTELAQSVRQLLEDIHPDSLDHSLLGIDQARASFVLESLEVENQEAFLTHCTHCYLHVLYSLGEIETIADIEVYHPQVIELLERAGGYKQFLLEALSPKQGGLHYVLNKLVQQLKQERIEQEVNFKFLEFVNPLDAEEQLAFIKAFLVLKKDSLPQSLLETEPEELLQDWQSFLKEFVEHEAAIQTTLRYR